MTTLDELLLSRKLLVAVGPGGVGKTTVSAALGLRAAELGRRTLVLTIDPAKRLADALGLTGLDDRIREVPTTSLAAAGVEVKGTLHAAMFDNATSMDSLMARVAPDNATRDKVLRNRVYRAMAGTLARSHAYLAMERLYEVMSSGDYDLVVLDTPPARNALDILDAPSRLASFLEEGVVKWFAGQKQGSGWRAKLMQGSGAAATKLFEVVVGKDLADETIAFFDAFYGMREGFHERAEATQKILRAKDTSFVLVSSADATHLADAEALAQGITSRGVPIGLAVFNRSYERLVANDPLSIITEAGELDIPSAQHPTSRYALLCCSPQTGRFRQIRRHLKHIHHHLIGDSSHGDGRHNNAFRMRGVHRMLLHAWRLSFPHPADGRELTVAAPGDSEWQAAMALLGWTTPVAPP